MAVDYVSKTDGAFGVGSIAELRSLRSFKSKRYYCSEKGKEGFWHVDSEDSATPDDGGLVLVTASGKRLKREIKTGEGLLEWFVGNDFSDGIVNLNAIAAMNKAGLKVRLPEGTIPLTTASATTSFVYSNPLIWEGAGKDKTKIILETKHSDSGGSGSHAYFKGNKSIHFKNLAITTRSIENGIFTEISDEYEFLSVTDPEKITVNIEGCRMSGAFVCRFFVTAGLELTHYVKLCRIRNTEFHYTPGFMGFSTYCETIDVQDNFIYELLGGIVFSNKGLEKNLVIKWKNNYLENTIIPSETQWYHCPLVCNGQDLYYENNVVKRLINKTKTVFQIGHVGSETYALYASVNNLHFKNNTVIDVLGQKTNHQDNCGFKVKGALNVYCENNEITLSKQAFVDAGILATIDSAYSTIDKNQFIYCLFGLAGNERVNKEFVFKKNRVKIPYVNFKCEVPYTHFNISDNHIEIDHVAKLRGQELQSIVFLTSQGSSESSPTAKTFADRNTIVVNEVESTALPVLFLANEFNQVTISATTVLRSLSSMSDNEFGGPEGTVFKLGVSPAKITKFEDNRTAGTGVTLEVEKIVCNDGSVVPLGNITQSYTTRKPKADALTGSPKLWGISQVKITDNALDKIFVMKTVLSDWLYNSLVSETNPILFEVTAEYQTSNGGKEKVQYNFAQINGSTVRYGESATNSLQTFDPRDDVNPRVIEFSNKDGVGKEAKFFAETFTSRTCHFFFTGLGSSREVTITVNVYNRAVTAATFYTPFLLPVSAKTLGTNLGLAKDPSFGLHQLGGGQKLESLINPSAPTVTNVGDVGVTSHTYYVVAEDRAGLKTLVSPSGSTSTANDPLSPTNHNLISWEAVPGARKYYVLKGDTGTLLGTTGGTSLKDTGQATSAFIPPTRNETADSLIDGRLSATELAVGNSAAGTTPGTVVKKIEVFDSTGNSLGFVPVYDSIN
jgi:hypothetical protein